MIEERRLWGRGLGWVAVHLSLRRCYRIAGSGRSKEARRGGDETGADRVTHRGHRVRARRPAPRPICLHARARPAGQFAERLVGLRLVALERHDALVDGIQQPARLWKNRVSSSAAGVIQLREPSTTGGASRSSKQSCVKVEATVCITQPRSTASVSSSTLPVLRTEAAIGSKFRGLTVRRSTNSAESPKRFCSSSATATAVYRAGPKVIMVRSLPLRLMEGLGRSISRGRGTRSAGRRPAPPGVRGSLPRYALSRGPRRRPAHRRRALLNPGRGDRDGFRGEDRGPSAEDRVPRTENRHAGFSCSVLGSRLLILRPRNRNGPPRFGIGPERRELTPRPGCRAG